MNTKVRTIIFSCSALLLLAGAVLHFSQTSVAPWIFAVGTAGVAVSYLTVSTKDMGFRTRRLHRYNTMASLLMIFASGLMFADRKEWVICLTIAALLQLYTAFVTPKEKE